MPPIARYLTHPQVLIDAEKEITRWSLSDAGRRRVEALAGSLGTLSSTMRVISSAETKALETVRPLASALGVSIEVRRLMHENDRSSTGFLPPDEFERVADQFFACPSERVRGWESAKTAQDRIVGDVESCLTGHIEGDVLFVGHGGVGTLLFCALADQRIDRRFDQGPGGGGCWFQFDIPQRKTTQGWQTMETMASGAACR